MPLSWCERFRASCRRLVFGDRGGEEREPVDQQLASLLFVDSIDFNPDYFEQLESVSEGRPYTASHAIQDILLVVRYESPPCEALDLPSVSPEEEKYPQVVPQDVHIISQEVKEQPENEGISSLAVPVDHEDAVSTGTLESGVSARSDVSSSILSVSDWAAMARGAVPPGVILVSGASATGGDGPSRKARHRRTRLGGGGGLLLHSQAQRNLGKKILERQKLSELEGQVAQ